MLELFTEMLEVMDTAFRKFEAAVPKPTWIEKDKRFRCEEQSIYQALIQKLARVQSALRASLLLLQHGYVMEVAVLHRVIDETNEDIEFLVCAVTNDKITPLHERYLKAFWAEEFTDRKRPGESHQSRDMVPRKDIRAYNARILGDISEFSGTVHTGKVINKTFSGFVHGASPHILESFGGNPPHFHTHGLLGTPRMPEYTRSLWNYMYRGLLSHIFIARALGAEGIRDELQTHKRKFEALVGVDYSNRPQS
jgi:hypothetical protein